MRVPLGLRIAARSLPPDCREEVLRELLEQHRAIARARGSRVAWFWAWRQILEVGAVTESIHAPSMWAGTREDIAAGFNALRRRPALGLTVIATVALSVGAIAAMASIVDAVFVRALPYPDAAQLVWVASHDDGPDAAPFDRARAAQAYANPLDVQDFATRARYIVALAPFETSQDTLLADGRPLRVDVAHTSAAAGAVLRIQPAYGRLFRTEDYGEGVHVLLLSNRLWRAAFHQDPSVVGRLVSLGGVSFEVIGVLPPTPIEFPTDHTDVWLPLAPPAADFANRGGVWQRVVARLQPGVSIETAERDFQGIAADLASQFPKTHATRHVSLVPYREGVVGASGSVIVLLACAVALVLVIAIANVGNLLLVSVQSRQRELAVRAALGAGTWRLARLLIAEIAWLSMLGGAGGLILAPWLLRLFLGLYPETLPSVGAVALHWPMLLVGIAAAAVGGMLALVPTMMALSSGRALTALRTTERGLEHKGQRRTRGALVVVQVALSTSLLIGGGLLVRTYWTMQHTQLGFDARNVLTFNVALGAEYAEFPDEIRFYSRLLEALRAIPGVRDAGTTTLLPLTPGEFGDGFYRVGFNDVSPNIPIARLQNVTAGYLDAIGLGAKRGRLIEPTDSASSTPVVVVNEAFEQKYFPDGALHRQIKFRGVVTEIVGVVASKQHRSLREVPRADMYFPRAQVSHPRRFAWVAVRTNGDPRSIEPAVRRVMADIAPTMAMADVDTMANRLDRALAPDRFRASMVGALAVVALLLATIGLYGLIAHAVARESRNIAIRMALGASAGAMLRRVLISVGVFTGAGVLGGIAMAMAARSFLASFLAGVASTDPVTIAAVAVSLLIVAFMAALGPALRARRIDPAAVLRSQ